MNIAYCSQYRDIQDKDWKDRACSICSLYMVLKSLREDFDLSPDDLLKEGLSIKGYSESGFWNHSSIAILSHNHGLPAYIEEFKSIPFGIETKYAEQIKNYGVEKIFNFIKDKKGLVIVSIPKDFIYLDKPHSVLIHNVLEENNEKYFIYNDSGKNNEEEGENLKISLEEFKEKWRKLAIFVNRI